MQRGISSTLYFLFSFIASLPLFAHTKTSFVSIDLSLSIDSISSSSFDSISLLHEVTIYASRFDRGIIPPQILQGEALHKLSSYSVADAMRYFSGIQVKDYGGVGGLKTINLRSMGSLHVGIFYDGVELGNAQNGQIDLGQYSLSNIESIALYNGQKSGTLQSAKDFGSSGTIYIKSRRPFFADGQKQNLRISFKTGSFSLVNPSLIWERALGKKHSLSLSGGALFSDGKYRFRYRRYYPTTGQIAYDTTAIRQNGDIYAYRVESSLFGQVSPYLKYQIKSYNYYSNRGIPGAIVNNVWRRGERQEDRNHFVQGIVEGKYDKRYSFKLLSKYAYYFTHYKNSDPTTIEIDNHYKQQEYYFSLAQSLLLTPSWIFSLAYDYLWNGLDSDLKDFIFPERNSHFVAFSSIYHSSKVDFQSSLLATFIKDYAKELLDQPQFYKLSPALLLSYRPFDKKQFRIDAFYKQSFRMPTFNDLYYADVGNSKLLPEDATQYHLSFNYTTNWEHRYLQGIDVSLQTYCNLIKNKIVAYPKGQQFRWTMLNLGKVFITGLESQTTIRARLFHRLYTRLHLQYTYQRAIDITDSEDSYYRHQIPYIPWHSGSLSLGCDFDRWSFNYSFIYVGERYNQRENILYNYTQPWYTSDTALSYDLLFGKSPLYRLRLQVECNNLFNQQYEVIANYPMPGRNFRVTLLWKL